MTLLDSNIFKTILFAVIFFSWKLYDTSCIWFALNLTVATFFLTMTFAESRLLYRTSLAERIFKESSLFYKWLYQRWFTVALSFFKAFVIALILLLNMMHWSNTITIVMVLDIALIMGIYSLTTQYYKKHVQDDISNLVARKTSVIVNVAFIVPILVIVMLYSSPPIYLESSIAQTIANVKTMNVSASCEILSVLLTYDDIREALGWWAIFKASSFLQNPTYVMMAWIIFLLIQTFYVWAFSKLMLSFTIKWNTRDSDISRYKPDSFSMGFFGIIILFALVAMNFLPNDTAVDNEPAIEVETHSTDIAKIISKLDTFANEERKKINEDIDSFIDAEVHNVFQSVYANIPKYAEQQYRWYRDYVTIYKKFKDKACVTYEHWKYFVLKHILHKDIEYNIVCNTGIYAKKSSDELQRVLFGNGVFDQKIYELQKRTNEQMQKLLLESENNLLKILVHSGDVKRSQTDHETVQNLNKAIEEAFLKAQNSLATTAMTYKVGEIGVTLVLTKTIMSKLLAKSGVKAVAKTGGFFGGAASGLTICAPSGVWAIACGVVTGTLTWIGVDFAVSEVDEILTREAFETKLASEIKRNEDVFKLRMQETYTQGINAIFEDIENRLHQRPIDEIRKKTTRLPVPKSASQ